MTAVGVLRHVVLVAATAVVVSGCLTISQSDADEEAAVVADRVLEPRLDRELRQVPGGSAQDRAQAIHSWLTAPDDDFLRSTHDVLWTVGEPAGSTIPVVVYALWTDTTFVNDSTWGRACREVDVGETITWREVPCPSDTPRDPPTDAEGGQPPQGDPSP